MTLARSLTAFLVLVLAGGALSAATPPIDWHLVVNVSPMTPFSHPTSEDRIRVLLRGEETPGCTTLGFSPPVVADRVIRIQGYRAGPSFECTPGTWIEELELPRLPVSDNGLPVVYTLEVFDEDRLIRSQPLEVFSPLKTLHFGFAGGSSVTQLTVSVRLTDPRVGMPRQASAYQATPQGGYFWFFDPDNIEVTIKLLDGRPVNGHLWVFLTGMSDLGYTITVSGEGCYPAVCPSKTYVNPPGRRLNVIDVTTF